ncbi:hypothetical protein ABIC10_008420 [Bradyrhizobium sp. S3.2.12]
MIAAGADLKIYVATRPIDFRCGHDGLAAKVQQMLRLDPFSGAAFVFRSKRADRIKILVWDRTGLVADVLEIAHEHRGVGWRSFSANCDATSSAQSPRSYDQINIICRSKTWRPHKASWTPRRKEPRR